MLPCGTGQAALPLRRVTERGHLQRQCPKALTLRSGERWCVGVTAGILHPKDGIQSYDRDRDVVAVLQVYNMRDLNPLHFFRGPSAATERPEGVDKEAVDKKAPMPRNASLLFDIEACSCACLLHFLPTCSVAALSSLCCH